MSQNDNQNEVRKEIKGQIFVQLPKTKYVSGETIKGTICINLEEEYEGHILQVTLEGTEDLKYNYLNNGKGSRKFKRKKCVSGKGHNRFVDFSIPIYDFAEGTNQNHVLIPSQWQIPFEIGIANLPPSFDYFEDSENYCDLMYKVTATIIPTNQSFRPFQGSQKISISKLAQVNQFGESHFSIDVTSKYCCASSSYKTDATIYNQNCSPGGIAKLIINGDFSNSGGRNYKFDIELVSLLTLKGQNYTNRADYQVVRRVEVKQELKYTEKLIHSEISLQIPVNTKQSTESDLINLEYYVIIQPWIYGSCSCLMSEKLSKIKFPINISLNEEMFHQLNSPPITSGSLPLQWAPIQLQSMQFSPEQSTYIQEVQTQFTETNDTQSQEEEVHQQ